VLNTGIKWKIQDFQRKLFNTNKRENRSWTNKETMDILKPEQAIS